MASQHDAVQQVPPVQQGIEQQLPPFLSDAAMETDEVPCLTDLEAESQQEALQQDIVQQATLHFAGWQHSDFFPASPALEMRGKASIRLATKKFFK